MEAPYTYQNSKGESYYLHLKLVTLKNGKEVTIYYFCRDQRDNVVPAAEFPQGYQVIESTRTALPLLKKV